MIDTEAITDTCYELARKDYSHQLGYSEADFREKVLWQKLRALGTRLWLDTGDVADAKQLWCSEFEALTTNNTLLNREIQTGAYDDFIREVARSLRQATRDIDDRRLILEIAFVLNAHHALELVELFDAHVSVELHTDLGNDVEGSVAYARRYFDICPERFYVNVPLTPAGLLAARKLGHDGVPVNLTLGFSARQNYLAALLAQPRFVDVLMGRLNAFVADNGLGDGQNVGEKTTLAAQRQLRALRESGRTRCLLIGASIRQSTQVASLAGLDVLTMPTKVASDYEANPVSPLSSQSENDPLVSVGAGVALSDLDAESLWEVPPAFEQSVASLLESDVDGLEPDELQAHFARDGFSDLLPSWSEEDIRAAAADGKIPVFDRWKIRLARRDIGLDALMNLSAFSSFATDQKALDDRIRSLI